MLRNTLILCIALVTAAGVFAGERKPTAFEQASTTFDAAMSRHAAGKWAEAAGLWEQFVKSSPTSERVPAAFLWLAHCRRSTGEFDKAEAACDEVIKNFWPSRFWYYAQERKLACLIKEKANDRYLDAVQAMLQKTVDVPASLGGMEQTTNRYATEFPWGWPWNIGLPYTYEPNDWSAGLLAMADTPERAARALKALGKMFARKAVDIPLDWQHVHLCLLHQSGSSAQADKLLKDYVQSWGKDPRAMSLLTQQAAFLQRIKDEKRADAIWEELLKNYAGYGDFGPALAGRMRQLAEANRLDEYFVAVRVYVRTYYNADADGRGWGWAVDEWLYRALQKCRDGGPGEVKQVLAVLDELKVGAPHWRLRAYVAIGDSANAAKAAEDLLSDAQWCAANFELVARDGSADPAVAKIIEAARAKRNIPPLVGDSPAAQLLGDLQKRLADDQDRFAEEIAQELTTTHRDNAAAIEAGALMAEYYYKKVLAQPRDRWINRMVEWYPQHPRTQRVLGLQIEAAEGERKYDRVGAVCETAMRLFPGAKQDFLGKRLEAFSAVQDAKGREAYLRAYLGDRVRTELGSLSMLYNSLDWNAIPHTERAEAWVQLSKSLAGTRGELYCYTRAGWEVWETNRREIPEPALPIARWLHRQNIDPQVRYKFEFMEADILLTQKKASEAVRLITDRIKDRADLRDLYQRVSYWKLAGALAAENKTEEGLLLVKKIKAACPSKEDQFAADYLEAQLLGQSKKADVQAGRKYLQILNDYPAPGLIAGAAGQPGRPDGLLFWGLGLLGNTPERHGVAQKLIKEWSGAQDLVPELLYSEGIGYLTASPPQVAGVTKFRNMLVDKYPASAQRNALEQNIQQTLNPPKKPAPEKKP